MYLASHSKHYLFGAVCFYVLLGRILRVLGSIHMVAMRQVRVMRRLFVVAAFVVPCSFVVVMRSMLMVFRRLLVVMG
jgi:hypothetical protein